MDYAFELSLVGVPTSLDSQAKARLLVLVTHCTVVGWTAFVLKFALVLSYDSVVAGSQVASK